VGKREIKTRIEIQKQAVDLDKKMFGVAAPAPAVGPWQWRSGSSPIWAGCKR
jgi:hypothetical protein